jgi:hypothetical protein
MPPAPKTRRRWYQFSVGAMFLVATVVGIMAWALSIHPWTIEHSTVGDATTDPSGVVSWSGEITYESNPALRWPVAAILALIAWKVLSLIAARRH